MASLPAPLRATLGLLATALDTVQELVERAPEIPMEAVGNSMQLSLRLQQQYVALVNRGDELIAGLRGAPEEPPAWATFDEGPAAPAHDGSDLPDAVRQEEPRHAGQGDPLLTAATNAGITTFAGTPHADEAAPTIDAAPVTPATPAKKAAPAKKTAPARKTAPAKKAASAKTASTAGGGGAKIASVKKAAGTVAPATKIAKRTTVKRAAPGNLSPANGAGKSAPASPRAAKVAASPAVTAAPPELDVNLDPGGVSARPVSAFDRVDAGPEYPVTAAATEARTAANQDTEPGADSTPPDSTS